MGPAIVGGDGLGTSALGSGPTSAATPSPRIEASTAVNNVPTGGVAADGDSAGQGMGAGIVATAGVADADILTAIDDVFATLAQR